MTETSSSTSSSGRTGLAARLARPEPLLCPGVYDAFSALLATTQIE